MTTANGKMSSNVASNTYNETTQRRRHTRFLINQLTTLNVPKQRDHIFNDKLKWNCPFTTIFGTLITMSINDQQVFSVYHLTYFMQLLYLGKLPRTKYHESSPVAATTTATTTNHCPVLQLTDDEDDVRRRDYCY